MPESSYETLRNWYLAKLRKNALDTAGEMTPSTLMAADRKAIDKLVAGRALEESAENDSGTQENLLFSLAGLGVVKTEQLSKSLKELNSNVRELSERENAIADYSLDLICSLSENHIIVALNPAIQVQLGHKAESLIGQSLHSLLLSEDLAKLISALSEGSKEGSKERNIAQVELRLPTISGSMRDFRWSFEWSESNKVYFCTARDITAERQLERVKNEFIAMVSHDLRAPLMSVQLTLGLLTKHAIDSLPDQYKGQVLAAETSVRSLISLINDLLDIEKMEAGRLQLNMSEVMVQDLFERAIVILRELATARSIKIEYEPTELEFKADGDRLEQVLVNLISNAIKFSPEGSVIKLEASESGRMIEVIVRDAGRGVPDEKRRLIFDRFQQSQSSDAERGTGLGLAICKLIVESHSGSIGVRTPPGGTGSEFYFQIPYRKIAKR